jgi:putative transcriptional regulator
LKEKVLNLFQSDPHCIRSMENLDRQMFENMPEVKTGSVLISEPFLKDPNFDRTVIIICKHSEEGSLGFVLNRPVELKLEEITEDFGGMDGDIFIGGPVQRNSLHFLHKGIVDIGDSQQVAPGLFWGGSFEDLKWKIKSGEISREDIRFFLGYSGWDKGQLDEEIDHKSWFVANLGDDSIFDIDPERLWRKILKHMGGKFKIVSNYPHDPRLN